MLSSDCFSLHLNLAEAENSFRGQLKEFGLLKVQADVFPEAFKSQSDHRIVELHLDTIEMYYKGAFVSSSTQSCSLGPGIIHLYRGTLQPTASRQGISQDTSLSSDVLAILAVPSYMTSADLLGFFGESLRQISHIRVLRTDDLRRFLVLIKFRTTTSAQSFQKKFDGALYNPMEPETVHCVHITSITFNDQSRSASDFPILTSQVEEGSRPVARQSLKAMPPAMPLTELPTCVVCLERMDATTTGLLTIACEHTFHCACLSKWVDTQATCPICRFSVARDVLKESEQHCFASQCSSDKNLWMCLICGAIHCGRYESQHAITHFNVSKHAFAMDLESGRIWDYSSDSYVHRLLQDKIGASSILSKQGSSAKLTGANGAEFEELLAAQLESQRLYYEEQVSSAINKASKANREVQGLEALGDDLRSQIDDKARLLKHSQEEVRNLRESHDRLEAKCKIISGIAQQSKKKADEEQAMNASLMHRISHLETSSSVSETQRRAMQDEISDLKEQVHDLLVHFASVNTLENITARDLDGATVQIAPPSNVDHGLKDVRAMKRTHKDKKKSR